MVEATVNDLKVNIEIFLSTHIKPTIESYGTSITLDQIDEAYKRIENGKAFNIFPHFQEAEDPIGVGSSFPAFRFTHKLPFEYSVLNKKIKIEILYKDIDDNEMALLDNLKNVTSCYSNNEEECNSLQYCLLTEDSHCKLLIPKTNLINGLYLKTIVSH